MNRRDALKAIGVLLGTTVTPSVARAISAGYRAPAPGSPYRVLTPQQGELLATLTEHIIPATDTPGARAARVDAFIDGLLADIFTADERTRFLEGLADVDARANTAHGMTFIKATPDQQVGMLTSMQGEAAVTPTGRPRRRRSGPQPRGFFPWLKELTLVGYYTSEIGASKELKYVHVAGRYDGDVPYRQVGRAYS
ncbi:MAG: gluconate 2-dehydrogenase subunit 3 family protein [Gemmatimonadaceae bacterium]